MNFAVKKADGESIAVYYDNGIIIKTTEGEKMICEEAQDDFDVIVSENDKLCIVCQDKKGNILYLGDGNGQSSIILESKSNNRDKKNIKLTKCGNYIHVLYVLSSSEKYILVHQILKNSDITPTAIDYTSDVQFDVISDKNGNIFIFYNEENNNSFVVRKYKWTEKTWSELEVLSESCASLNSIALKGHSINLVYIINNTLFFRKYHEVYFGRYNWSEAEEICGIYMPKNLCLVFYKKECWIMWETEFGIFGTYKNESKDTFVPPTRIISSFSGKLEYIKVRNAYAFDFECSFNEIYGSINKNQINFIIDNDFFKEIKPLQRKNNDDLVRRIEKLESRVNYIENKLNRS